MTASVEKAQNLDSNMRGTSWARAISYKCGEATATQIKLAFQRISR